MEKVKLQKLVIDGVTYVPENEVTKEVSDNYFIVRTYSAGVFAGEIVSRNAMEVEMKNARRLWYWDGAASLSQLAVEGVKKPQNCKFPVEVPKVILTQVIEIIPCTKESINSIKGVPIWEQ